jgi:Flp pilus assembly protein TadG
MRRSQKESRRVRGNAIIEFALSVAILLPALVGTMQFGFSFLVYGKLEAAMREGARYAALRTYDSSTATPSTAFTTAVQNMVVYSNPNGGTTPLVRGLTTDQIIVTTTMYNGVPDMITVKLTSFQVDAAVAKVNISGKPWATYRYQGRFAPP